MRRHFSPSTKFYQYVWCRRLTLIGHSFVHFSETFRNQIYQMYAKCASWCWKYTNCFQLTLNQLFQSNLVIWVLFLKDSSTLYPSCNSLLSNFRPSGKTWTHDHLGYNPIFHWSWHLFNMFELVPLLPIKHNVIRNNDITYPSVFRGYNAWYFVEMISIQASQNGLLSMKSFGAFTHFLLTYTTSNLTDVHGLVHFLCCMIY